MMGDKPRVIGRSESVVKLVGEALAHWDQASVDARYEAHLGLLFEKFPRLMRPDASRYTIPADARRNWARDFVKAANQAGEATARLSRINARLDALTKRLGGQRREFETQGRLAVGLGNPNAADIGLSLDWSTGLPVLPGSSVKGLAAEGARLAGRDESDPAFVRVFGRGPEPGSPGVDRAGCVAFLDATPVTWPLRRRGSRGEQVKAGLDVDVITRHHDPEKVASQGTPLDADQPNPVHFVTVSYGVKFAFRLLPVNGGTEIDLSAAWEWLEAALRDLGAGGKTAVGYGQMVAVKSSGGGSTSGGGKSLLDDLLVLAERVAKNNITQVAPKVLKRSAGLPKDERRMLVETMVEKVGRKWLENKQGKKKYAIQMFEILDGSPESESGN